MYFPVLGQVLLWPTESSGPERKIFTRLQTAATSTRVTPAAKPSSADGSRVLADGRRCSHQVGRFGRITRVLSDYLFQPPSSVPEPTLETVSPPSTDANHKRNVRNRYLFTTTLRGQFAGSDVPPGWWIWKRFRPPRGRTFIEIHRLRGPSKAPPPNKRSCG